MRRWCVHSKANGGTPGCARATPTADLLLRAALAAIALLFASPARASDGAWTSFFPPPPEVQSTLHSAVYDSLRDRMIVYGGHPESYYVNGPDLHSFSFQDSLWAPMPTQGPTPPRRRGHTLVYDPLGDRLLLYGGYRRDVIFDDLWELPLSGVPQWIELHPGGSGPGPLAEHAAVVDRAHGRMLIVGGSDGSTRSNQVWQLSLVGPLEWTLVPTVGTFSARHSHTATIDPAHDRLVLFGGHTGAPRRDAFTLTLSGAPTWTTVAIPSPPLPPRKDHAAAYDPVHDRIVVWGGKGSQPLADAWSLRIDGSPAWAAVAVSGESPASRYDAACVLDTRRSRLVVHGGVQGMVQGPAYSIVRSDLWALDLHDPSSWKRLLQRRVPAGRISRQTVFDSVGNQAIVVNGGGPELWMLPLDTLPLWRATPNAGDHPYPGLHYSSVEIHPATGRLYQIGGYYLDQITYRTTNNVWTCDRSDSARWQMLQPTGGPPLSRGEAVSILDSVRNRILLFGGWHYRPEVGMSDYLNDLWQLSIGDSPAWTQLFPGGETPPQIILAAAVLDTRRNRMLLFGGEYHIPPYGVGYSSDTWALSLGDSMTWQKLVVPGPAPAGRYLHSAIYDPIGDRLIVYGGSQYLDPPYSDVWALGLSDSLRWHPLEFDGTPLPLRFHSSLYDPRRDRMVTVGEDGLVEVLEFPPARLSVSPVAPKNFRVSQAFPNPASAGCAIRLELPHSVSLDVTVYDLNGRAVAELGRGFMNAGVFTMKWDAQDRRNHRVGPGIYFIRVRSGAETFSRRVVVLP